MITGLIIGGVVGFVVGVLFSRRNKNKVEKVVSEAKEAYSDVKKKF